MSEMVDWLFGYQTVQVPNAIMVLFGIASFFYVLERLTACAVWVLGVVIARKGGV